MVIRASAPIFGSVSIESAGEAGIRERRLPNAQELRGLPRFLVYRKTRALPAMLASQ